jgi:hypothetical protein
VIALSIICGVLVLALILCLVNPSIRINAVDNWRQGLKFLSLWPIGAGVLLQGIDMLSANQAVIDTLPGLAPITHTNWYHGLIAWLGVIGMLLRFVKQTHAASPDIVPPLPDVEKK